MATRLGTDLIRQMNDLRVPPGCLAIWGLGQMGVALKGDDSGILYIDPCLSDVAALRFRPVEFVRAFPPPLEPEQVTNARYVLLTHEHLDHTDPLTLGPLGSASPAAQFVTTPWAYAALDEANIPPERRIAARPDEPLTLGNIRVTVVPCAHYNVEHDERGYRWLSFHIEWNGVTFYHSGDTVIYPGYMDRLKALPRADVAMLAANGRDTYREQFDVVGNLMPIEAAWLSSELGWDLLIGGHNDLYAWNTVAAGALADELRRLNPRQKYHTLQPGELYLYVR